LAWWLRPKRRAGESLRPVARDLSFKRHNLAPGLSVHGCGIAKHHLKEKIMATQGRGNIMHGVTGRMGTNQLTCWTSASTDTEARSKQLDTTDLKQPQAPCGAPAEH
jgi:hypothetical protein